MSIEARDKRAAGTDTLRTKFAATTRRLMGLGTAAAIAVAAIGLAPLGSSGALAATQGKVGPTSTGSINITLTIRNRIEATAMAATAQSADNGRFFCITGAGAPLYRVKSWRGNGNGLMQPGQAPQAMNASFTGDAARAGATLDSYGISDVFMSNRSAEDCEGEDARRALFAVHAPAGGSGGSLGARGSHYVLTVVPE